MANLIDQFVTPLTPQDMTNWYMYMVKGNKTDDGRIAFADLFNNLGTGTGGLRLGAGAGIGNTTGNDNICIGTSAGANITTGSANVVVAAGTILNAAADEVVAIGDSPLISVTSASLANVIAVGEEPLANITTGILNSVIAIGEEPLHGATSAVLTDVIAIGDVVLAGMVGGTLTDTVAIGHSAGATTTGGNHCTFIGSGANTNAGASSYRTAIGAGAVATADHQCMLATANETVVAPGNAAIAGSGKTLGFLGATPVVQQANSVDLGIVLSTFGLRGAGGNPSLNLGSGALTAGALVLSGQDQLGAAAGAAGGVCRLAKAITGMADAADVMLFTITVPNVLAGAMVRVTLHGTLGDGDSTDSAIYDIGVSRVAGTNAKAVAGAKTGAGATAGVSGNATVIITVPAVSGAVGDSNTFAVTARVTRSAGAAINHFVTAEVVVLNGTAGGVTIS